MLDPVELADGADRGSPAPRRWKRRLSSTSWWKWMTAVGLRGRRCRPSATYWPRCPCCALLLSPETDALDSPGMPPGFVFAESHRVRLDLQTGVCVATEELGGTRDGWGHGMRIETVNEAMPESLFKRPSKFKRSRFAR